MSAIPLVTTVPAARPAVLRRVSLLVLHCSATPSGQWIGSAPGTPGAVPAVKSIDNWHLARGFRRTGPQTATFNPQLTAIGYHYVVDLDGSVATGRHLDEIGAHAQGFNSASVGVCLVGGAERDARYTAQQWAALAQLVRRLAASLGLPLAYPLQVRQGPGICGHRDLSPDTNADNRISPHEWLKTCPGFDVGAWLGRGLEPRPEQVCPMPGADTGAMA